MKIENDAFIKNLIPFIIRLDLHTYLIEVLF